MRIVWNVFLGLAAATAALALLFQGFAFTALSPALSLWLRIVGTVCCQWFFLRVSRKRLVQAVPVIVSMLVAVWGFFLYLTSPSWLNATFQDFLSDYAIYAIGCILVLFLTWLLPRLIPRMKKAIHNRMHKKKETTPPPQGYAKKKKGGKR